MRTVRIGILHSLTGVMAVSEKPLVDASLLAVGEINESGGILGHRLEAIVRDGESSPEQFARQANYLISEGVVSIFGCWTSSSRKAVKPVVEKHHSLLWYPVQYEGLEQSSNIIYTGSCLNQQIEPAVVWAVSQGLLSCYLIGSDYLFPRTANNLIRLLVTHAGGRVLSERYVPFGAKNFEKVMIEIRDLRPDIIYNTINGSDNFSFFKQFSALSGGRRDSEIMSFSFSETELAKAAHTAVGTLSCWSYFRGGRSKENTRFLKRMKEAYGDEELVSDPSMTAYSQIRLWSSLVSTVRSFSTTKLLENISGHKIDSPGGVLKVASNQHVYKKALVGRVNSHGRFDVVWRSNRAIKPLPFFGVENVIQGSTVFVREVMEMYPDMIQMNADLEALVKRRTSELQARHDELEVFNKAMVGRETKIVELKEEVNRLLGELGRSPAYSPIWNEDISKTLPPGSKVGVELYERDVDHRENERRTRELEAARRSALSLLQDATAQREKTEKISQELRKLTQAVEQSPISVIMTDLRGNITYVNPKFSEVTGYTKEEVVGKNSKILSGGVLPKEHYRGMWKVLASGDIWHGEFCNRKKNGELYWESASISPVRDNQGRTVYYVAVTEDVTKVKRTEELLKQAKASAEAASKAKSDFLANVSHEIRTPMNAIIGLNSLLRKTRLTPAQDGYAEKIGRSARHLLTLINELLDFSKIESGKFTIEHIEFELNDVFEELLNNIESKARDKGLEVNLTVDKDIPETLIGDPFRLGQVLLNLVDNAVKFTREGKIKVSCDVVEKDENKANIKFSVRDSGIGMTSEQVSDLFQPFKQADTSTTRKFGGTGLGLAISKNLIELMNGRVWVESEINLGSVFSFAIPFDIPGMKENEDSRDGSASTNEAYSTYLSDEARDSKVLVVENNEINREVVHGGLSNLGVCVVVASSGREAVSLIEQASPGDIDLVLMDLQMPDMNGYEATRAIRDVESYKNVPIIAMTADAMNGVREKCFECGMDDFVCKPLDPDGFLALVLKWLSKLSFQKAYTLLDEVRVALEQASTKAIGRFNKLNILLRKHGFARTLNSMKTLIERYEFDQALELVDKLRKEIAEYEGGRRYDRDT